MSMLCVPDEIAARHDPMNADDAGYVLCARDDEVWPCDSAQLLALVEAHNRGHQETFGEPSE